MSQTSKKWVRISTSYNSSVFQIQRCSSLVPTCNLPRVCAGLSMTKTWLTLQLMVLIRPLTSLTCRMQSLLFTRSTTCFLTRKTMTIGLNFRRGSSQHSATLSLMHRLENRLAQQITSLVSHKVICASSSMPIDIQTLVTQRIRARISRLAASPIYKMMTVY